MDISVYSIVLTVVVVSVVHGSRKKGVGIDLKAYKCDDLKALDNMAWWYDWGPNFDKIESESGCNIDDRYLDPFVPMIWGYSPNWSTDIYRVDHRNEFILGFNEPNHKAQANLSPQEAADAWHIVEYAGKNTVIVSPAAAKCGGGVDKCIEAETIDWLDQFFGNVCAPDPGPCRVDYIATHIYTCKATKLMRLLTELYDKYKLQIWLTEFACPYDVTVDEQLEFMQAALPLLEESDYVYRYAWYVHRKATPSSFILPSANLFETGSSTLTRLGQWYNDYTYPDDPSPAGVCRASRKRR
ncbi:uncharacterized protein LOC123535253 isoform X2 [Mercenaria mercenaria]|nr:uncharacterized protein LOC123535253 isoform X2 [Mercenaria mercenaria]XP_045173777.1 uncharacterized protein LOC123535253 isoform X2 [Mercenaria mercenaria]